MSPRARQALLVAPEALACRRSLHEPEGKTDVTGGI